MNVLNYVKLVSLALLIGTTLIAQHQGPGKFGPRFDIEMMKTTLNLSEEQENQLQAIKEKYETEREALLETALEDRMEQRAAMQALMLAQKEEIEAVLTEEQLKIMEETRAAKREEMRNKWQNVDRKALRAALKEHHEKQVKPIMGEQRLKLEAKISAEDKASIAELRSLFGALKKGRDFKMMDHPKEGETRREREQQRLEKREAFRAEHQEQFDQLKGLVQKYRPDIELLLEEVAAEMKEIEASRKEILEQYLPAGLEKGRRHRHRNGNGERAGRHQEFVLNKKYVGFLLMDPLAEAVNPEAGSTVALTEVSIFPNPATSFNTIKYVVKTAGQIRIELHREDGNSIKVVVDAYRDAGEYTEQVDLSMLQDGAYYYSVVDQNGISTRAVIISKQ